MKQCARELLDNQEFVIFEFILSDENKKQAQRLQAPSVLFFAAMAPKPALPTATTTSNPDNEHRVADPRDANPATTATSQNLSLSITTGPFCVCCGDILCGSECTFLQREFDAAVLHSGGAVDSVEDSTNSMDNDAEDTTAAPDDSLPTRQILHRTKSCGVHTSEYDQDQLMQRNNSFFLRQSTQQSSQSRMQQVLERLEGADVSDPSFSMSESAGSVAYEPSS